MKKKFFTAAFLLLCIVAAGLSVAAYVVATQPMQPGITATTRFVIPKGQGISQIGQRLTEAGFLRYGLVFRFWVWKEGKESQIQAGSFLLSAGMTPLQLVDTLTKGTDDVWVKILEGWRVEEIAEAVAAIPELTEFDAAEFIQLAGDEEGTLFPDTYLVQKSISAAQLHRLLTDTFQKKVLKPLQAKFDSSAYFPQEVVTMASLIQREAGGDDAEMRMIAGVLQNRMDAGMALDVDATLQYIAGYSKTHQSWWVPPSISVKESTSPFNTYKQPGLPPRPICNPGLAAIEAALDPAAHDYVFYIHDTKGMVHFAKTIGEHNRNVQMYLR